nr:histidine phosphatase family protein [Stakelama flava]
MRHGETALAGKLVGHHDCEALPHGISACANRARALGLGKVRLISSDLKRASACAAAIGTPTLDPRWRELDFGQWDGLATSQINAERLTHFWDDPDASPPPGGERWSALVARVAEAIAALSSEPTLVVTHGGAMRAALHCLCGFSIAQTWAFDLPCASVLALSVWHGGPRRAQVTGLWA